MVNIKQLIKDKGISQVELSRLLNEHTSVVSLLVNGKRELTETHLARLVEIFGEEVISQYDGLTDYEVAEKDVMVNIKGIITDFNLTQTDIAKIMGEPQSVVSTLANGKRKQTRQHIDALIAHFGQEVIDKYTLPADAYEPKVRDAKGTIEDAEVIEGKKEEIKEEVLKTTVVLPAEIIRDPDINIKQELKAGNLQEYAQPVQDTLPEGCIKVYTYCDDMEPEIRAGEPVLVRLLPVGIPIVPGDMYFIDMPSGGKIRYIEKEKEGKLYLKARNAAYGDIIIDREKVQSLFTVMMILRTPRSMSIKESTAQEMLINKDRHLDRLLDQMEKGGERERMLIDFITKDK